MTMVAVPNVSEGRSEETLTGLARALQRQNVRVLDTHSDAVHNRSVFTVIGQEPELIEGLTALAVAAAASIDLTTQTGVHPRLGALDVCPFVAYQEPRAGAISLARSVAERIGRSGLPVYLYGDAATREETRELPDIRRGGLTELARRAVTDLPPDDGPAQIDLRTGVVCVGARGPLIAFNVNIAAPVQVARRIASWVRDKEHGLFGVRALGLEMPTGSQVSMNLTDPVATGIERAFLEVETAAQGLDAAIMSTEIVGLVEERFLPSPNAKVTRFLVEPGHSLEAALQS